MNTPTTAEPRNRVYPAGEDEVLRHLFDAERMGYAETRDYVPRYGGGPTWGEDEGEPASGRQTAAIVGVIVAALLLLAGLAYLAWSGAHGSYIWAR